MRRFAVLASVASLFVVAPARADTAVINLQPSSAWAVGPSGIGPVCDPPSPAQTNWAETAGMGVTLSVAGTNIQCCDCIRRSALFAVGTTTIAGSHLTGKFVAQNVGKFADGSFRVIMKSRQGTIGHTVFATEQRANNNCACSSEEPETIVNSGQMFDIDLSKVNTNQATDFDTLQIEVLGYACPDGSGTTAAATATLSDVQLVSVSPAADSGGGVAPMTPADVMGPWAGGPVQGAAADAGSVSPVGGKSSSGGGKSGGCAIGAPAVPATSIGVALVLGAISLAQRRRRHL